MEAYWEVQETGERGEKINSIDFEEFYDWVSNDEEIQDFLVENMQYQTRTHALNIYKQYYDKYIACFPNYAALKEAGDSPVSNPEETKKSSEKIYVLCFTYCKFIIGFTNNPEAKLDACKRFLD